MFDWAVGEPTAVTVIALVLAALVVVLAVLLLLSARNGRLLSIELNAADRSRAAATAAADERGARLRVIRELNDVAVQNLARIVTRSDAARYVVDADPAVVSRAAAHIGDVARSTLADLRRIVDLASDGATPSRSSPGIASVAELIVRMEQKGLIIRFSETGSRFLLEQGAEAAVYRIIDEALENALRHGGTGTEVAVSITWTEIGMRVLVDDNGMQATSLRSETDQDASDERRRYSFEDDIAALTSVVKGAGVSTMRTRAGAFGGVFTAHPVPGVGFTVSATFPSLRTTSGAAERRMPD